MNTPTQQTATGSPEATWFASEWLRSTTVRAVRTAPIIAMLQELLRVLRDEQIPDDEAYTSLRRAVRLLAVLDAETGTRKTRERVEYPGDRIYVPTPEDVARSADSNRFAIHWLRGSPHAAIRTTPIIKVIEELLDTLLDQFTPAQDVQTSLHRAVRLLTVFTTDGQRNRPHPTK
ncbi:hypothetical protein RB614_42380 [Phytohabitans sp. ZYX-F-186]|uniref:Uncharacterized protein n=1 Tax=Phytohabitans maris TaxID=3071409 RepID=A0ABU0ZVV0_9ACTN|nr:hypothetical protein [Phytohabitans sp. ZYX-F-186]MDQ7911158.1 hypothetical protein [Phytohabitans sp. ZYX-F-186]